MALAADMSEAPGEWLRLGDVARTILADVAARRDERRGAKGTRELTGAPGRNESAGFVKGRQGSRYGTEEKRAAALPFGPPHARGRKLMKL